MPGTLNPGRALGVVAKVGSLDSRLRGNDGSTLSSGLNIITLKMTVIPGKRSATRNPDRAFRAVVEVGSLDSRLRGNDGSTLSSGLNIITIKMTVIPGRGLCHWPIALTAMVIGVAAPEGLERLGKALASTTPSFESQAECS